MADLGSVAWGGEETFTGAPRLHKFTYLEMISNSSNSGVRQAERKGVPIYRGPQIIPRPFLRPLEHSFTPP